MNQPQNRQGPIVTAGEGHTPTPWEVIKYRLDGRMPNPVIVKRGGRSPQLSLAAVHDGCGLSGGFGGNANEQWANAKFIVEACNNHDTIKAENERLRKALEQIVRRAFNEEPAEDLDDTQRDLRHIHATAVAALKEPK